MKKNDQGDDGRALNPKIEDGSESDDEGDLTVAMLALGLRYRTMGRESKVADSALNHPEMGQDPKPPAEMGRQERVGPMVLESPLPTSTQKTPIAPP